jgi:hypothetical protein
VGLIGQGDTRPEEEKPVLLRVFGSSWPLMLPMILMLLMLLKTNPVDLIIE